MTRAPEHLVHDLRYSAFAASARRRVGAEVELIPVDVDTRRPAWIEARAGREGRATLPVLRAHARSRGWHEEESAKAGIPEFRVPGGGRITFEPGGQIEYSAPPSESVSALVDSLGSVVVPLRQSLADAGIDTLTCGLDPVNAIERSPMQLAADRYRRMARHFQTVGSEGARMMRQTASIQICLDSGDAPLDRWRLLNALAPYVVAIFANSPIAEGEASGYLSTRRRIWSSLDPTRTGVFAGSSDPVQAYADFACRAGAILLGADEPPFASFGEWAERGIRHEEWRAHLTTLFPEVRPRGYFEVRSCDALPPEWYAVPLTFVAALAYGPDRGRTALEIAGPPDASVLEQAGQTGLEDPAFAERAMQLTEWSLCEAESLGAAFVDGETVERSREFFTRFTRARRTPASEQLAPIGV